MSRITGGDRAPGVLSGLPLGARNLVRTAVGLDREVSGTSESGAGGRLSCRQPLGHGRNQEIDTAGIMMTDRLR
jgi:hypothetical protein